MTAVYRNPAMVNTSLVNAGIEINKFLIFVKGFSLCPLEFIINMLILFVVLAFKASAFDFFLPKLSQKCFGEDLSVDTLYVAEISTKDTKSDYKPLAIIISHQNWPVYKIENTKQAKHSFVTTNSGEYNLCVINQSNFEVYVSLSIKIGISNNKDLNNLLKKADLKESELKLLKIQESLKRIRQESIYIRQRETDMRGTNETIYSRITGYSIITILILCVIGILQSLYLKNFFKSKKLV